MPYKITPTTSTLFLFAFIIAFFPGLFITIIQSPFKLLLPAPLHPPTAPAVPCSTPCSPPSTMSWSQKSFSLPTASRGVHLVTEHVVSQLPELKSYKVGLLHLFAQHTSCALQLNENWDGDVRLDMADALDRIVPEEGEVKDVRYRHSCEGSDDMPAHVKSVVVGPSVTIPISDGRLALGTWQGIYHLEFRDGKRTRKLVATIQGEKK